MESPWQRAYQQQQQQEALNERAAQAQLNAEGAGLGGMVGIMLAAAAGPRIAKAGGRKLVKMLGKHGTKQLKKVRKGAKARAKKAGELTGDESEISESYYKKAAQEDLNTTVDRAKYAAAKQDADDIKLDQFLADAGISDMPLRTRKGAKEYRDYAKSDKAKQGGTLRAFLSEDLKTQRSLARSFKDHMTAEQALALPTSYAIDSQMGITGAPEDRELTDLSGHAKDFINYLPTYATYEVGGMAALGARRGLTPAANKLKQYAQNSPGLGRAIGNTYDNLSRAANYARDASAEFQNRFNREVSTRSGMNQVQEGVRQAEEYVRTRASQAKGAVQGFLSREGEGAHDVVNQSESLRSAEDLIGTKKGRQAILGSLRDAKPGEEGELEVGAGTVVGKVMDQLFTTSGDNPLSRVARFFGAEAVTVGDLQKADMPLTKDAKESLSNIRTNLDSLKKRIAREADQGEGIDADLAQNVQQKMSYENLRAEGYVKIDGKIQRMPTGSDLLAGVERVARRATTVRVPFTDNAFAVSDVVGMGALRGKRNTVEVLEGSYPLRRGRDDKMVFFGDEGTMSVPEAARGETGEMYRRGFAIRESGFRKGRAYGQTTSGGFEDMGSMYMGPKGKGSVFRTAQRRAMGQDETYARRPEDKVRQQSDFDPSFIGQKVNQMRKMLRLGMTEGGVLRRTRDLMSKASPRRLFGEEGAFWSMGPLNAESRTEALKPVADAVAATRQAFINATSVYSREPLMGKALKNIMKKEDLEELGGVEAIMNDDRVALKAARKVLAEQDANLGADANKQLRAPTAAKARSVVNEAKVDPASLHSNVSGERKADTLRRYLFEQGALGAGKSRNQISSMMNEVDTLMRRGEIDEKAGLQAKAGLIGLDAATKGKKQLTDPYRQLSDNVAGEFIDDYRTVNAVLRDHKDALQAFGDSRPRVDVSYNRSAYSDPDFFGAAHREGDFMMTDYSLGGVGSAYVDAGFETMRRALSEVGLGWSPRTSVTTKHGRKELMKTWSARAGATVGGALAYRVMDGGLDMAVPDGMPLDEGIGGELADIAANSRLAASYIYDTLGVTEAAQYMEGLAPKSTSILPGALAGYYGTGGILGAVAGATLNRAMQPLMKDTPFEALSILPPLAPFVSDMTEDYEETKAKYEGRQMVAQRKGRFYMLSSSNYEGGRIEQYRPNWYTEQKADVGATPVQYGSKLEEMIFKDLPLIDFAPGDLYDPQYLAKKHAESRPFKAPDLPFSEVPVVGPLAGATVGRAYNMLHPAGNAPQTGTEGLVGGFDRSGSPVMGISDGSGAQLGGMAYEGLSAYTRQSQTVVGANSVSALADEQFYRGTEAMGFLGFLTQQAAGGEGLTRYARMESASKIDSATRSFHDQEMGDMLGIGEAARRIMPYERGGAQYGPRNTMPDWMPDDFKYGDPYCLAPDTLVEVNGILTPAKEAHERMQSGEQIYVRTHKNRTNIVLTSAEREVDEELVNLRVYGIPWPIRITKGHPVLVATTGAGGNRGTYEWKLAGELEEGDLVCQPMGGEDNELVVGDLDYWNKWGNRPQKTTLTMDAEVLAAIASFLRVEAKDSTKINLSYLSEHDRTTINRGFRFPGSNYRQRDSVRFSELRRQMADYGFPLSMPGARVGALQALVRHYAVVDKDNYTVSLRVPLSELRYEDPKWQGWTGYEPETTDDELLSHAGYTLLRTMAEAGVNGGSLEIYDDRIEYVLCGGEARSFVFSNAKRNTIKGRSNTGWAGSPCTMRSGHVARPVQSVETEPYEGPVYAFQVEGDESFVVSGIATHNSKIAKGEALLPGAGMESLGTLSGEMPELDASNIGADVYDTALRTLDIEGSPQGESWARQATIKRLRNAGVAVRAEAAYVDEQTGVTAVADAATKGNNPIMVREVKSLEGRMRAADRERLNAAIGASGRSRGMQVYVDETGAVETYQQEFDSQMYKESVAKLEAGRERARQYAEQGYGKPGSMYSTTDRLQVLQNADPFGDEFNVEMRKAKKMYYGGMMSMDQRADFERIAEQQKDMRLPFEMYDKRFNAGDLLTPTERNINMTYNENVEAAANYSLPERIAGSVYEAATSMRTPLHTKFFGNYSAEEQYERRVLLERDFQSWNDPVDDFIRPYAHGLMAADDPMQGAASFAMGGATFGNPAIGATGAVVGAAYGAARGVYESISGNETFTPSKIEDMRQITQQMDRTRYYRAKRLYDATGAKQYLDEMEETATGWSQSGLSGTGWAKNRRRSYGPAARLESDLYNTDQGFSSPWQGLKAVRHFKKALMKHGDDTLSIGMQKVGESTEAMKRASSSMSAVMMKPKPRGSHPRTVQADSQAKQVLADASQPRPVTAAGGQSISGFSEGGMAKQLRSQNTQVRSGRGFGSPYRGEDAEEAVQFHGKDPLQQALPPEMFTGFRAAPADERDFVRAFFMAEDEDRRQEITELVSQDMAAVLETGWNYMDGRSLSEQSMDVLPQKGMRADLTAHPAMGLGADMESYHIRSLEDSGIAAHDAGIGWQGAYARMEGARVAPAAIDSVADATQREAPVAGPEMKMIIELALQQMGMQADVRVEEIAGPSEIHLRQQ